MQPYSLGMGVRMHLERRPLRIRPRGEEPQSVSMQTLRRQQRIPAPVEDVFAFFADAQNLAEITPRWLGFKIKSPLPIEMKTGATIVYRIRLAGWPVRWVTRIATWNPPRAFVDRQETGPYSFWEHTHEFHPDGPALRMVDTVRYELPLGLIGRWVHALAVRPALNAIFDYRRDRIAERFGGTRSPIARPVRRG